MEWCVYKFDVNKQKIEKFNVFDHYRLLEDIKKNCKKLKDKDEFLNQLKKDIQYYYWSKVEYELVIKKVTDKIYLYPWCGCRFPDKVKIDVTNDEILNWKDFASKHIATQIFYTEAKIDIYDQLEYMWEEFSEYVWNNRGISNFKILETNL